MKPLRQMTFGEVNALPEPQRTEVRRQIVDMVIGAMVEKDERAVDKDYGKTGTYKNTRWGE